MRHVCEPLSLDELEEAFNGQAMDIGLINIIEIGDELSPRCDDRLMKTCDLLVLGECDTGFAPAFGVTCMGLRAYRMIFWSENRTKTSERWIILRWVTLWLVWFLVPWFKPLGFLTDRGS